MQYNHFKDFIAVKLYYILHSMLAQKGANAIKIISVAVGLLVSILVFCRLDYNYSYDTCFPDRDNLYQIMMKYEINGQILGPVGNCPGKLAECAIEALGNEIIAATAIGRIGLPDLFDGDRRIDIRIVGADSLFFETMGMEVLLGNPSVDFATPYTLYLNESTAKQLYGDENPIGKTLTFDRFGSVTVAGVFRDLPKNVTVDNIEGLLSQPSATIYERRRQWQGADNWPIYFRMKPDSNLTEEEINRRLNASYQTHVPDTDDYKSLIIARPISRVYLELDAVKRMNLILWILGSALLLMTTLNYVLITIASLSRRAKSIGVHKCSGAGSMTVMGMFLWETLLVLGCSIILMIALLFLFEPIISDTLSLSLSDLFASQRLWVPLVLLGFFFLVGGLLPGRIFARIPVTQVFRRFTERNSAWKRGLLFTQITGVSFICSLLVVISLQYREVLNRDMGFNYDRLVYVSIPYTLDPGVLTSTLRDLPYVEGLACSESMPFWNYSGEMVYSEDGSTTLFNTRTDWVGKGYINLLGFTLLKGREAEREDEIVISEEFARRYGIINDPIGRTVRLSGGNNTNVTVVGLIKDYALGGFINSYADETPAICLSPTDYGSSATLRLKEPFDQNYKQLCAFLKETFPRYDFNTMKFEDVARERYSDIRMFRNSTMIAAIALIFISLMGLVGFARDEVQRRSKEIAIRKVNGAEAIDIVNLLLADVLRIAVPAIAIGTLCAAYIGHLWLENFTVTAPHLWLWYLLAALAVLILITACILSITLRTANENPVNRLKAE